MAKNQTPLKDRPWLTIPQCQDLLARGREFVEARIASGDFSTRIDGARVKIETASVRAWVDGQTRALRGAVGLPTPDLNVHA